MLSVAINAVSAKSGGAATYIENLGKELAKSDYGNQYLFCIPPKRVASLEGLGDRIRVVASDVGYRSSWRRQLWDQVTLRQILRKEHVDVLLSSSDFGMWFPPCKQILMVRNPLFFSPLFLRTVLPNKSRQFRLEFWIRRWLISLSVRASDIVIAASRSMMADLKQLIPVPDSKAVVNSFGVPLERFSWNQLGASEKVQRDSERPCQLLYVSEYSDYKNLTTLLKAVSIMRTQGMADFRLMTTADPSQFPEVEIVTREQDRALVSHPHIAPFVKFTGSIPYEDVPNLYMQSDLFVFPSLAESFGHPLVEAMASGLPIIASDIPICREICGDAAVYFSPLDPNDLAEKIMSLRNDSGLRQRLGRLGRKRAEVHFDWKDHVRRLVGIIERVAANGRG
ncbi:MAG: glycosyltransferase family 4 protein [candidate division NC10 bacterium]|nr:glycosyltransferase family 4 protein [candidate division NC10 bacterium]MDE2320345.1 glycosyltransferase family 4 protein [candidate division NC10 bacterium]